MGEPTTITVRYANETKLLPAQADPVAPGLAAIYCDIEDACVIIHRRSGCSVFAVADFDAATAAMADLAAVADWTAPFTDLRAAIPAARHVMAEHDGWFTTGRRGDGTDLEALP